MTSNSSDTDNEDLNDPSPRIGIIGVGGAGGNAINNMIRAELSGVNFLAANTDAQALAATLAPHSLQLGAGITGGLGSGAQITTGRAAAKESVENLRGWVSQCDLLFIAAGMGGGTGTGAAPVIAELARAEKTLTVGVVTLPFDFEGPQRMRTAVEGMQELEQLVDTLIVIPNQNLFAVANAATTFGDAFRMADDVLHNAIRGITDLIVLPGLINLDFADVRSVITRTGRAMMGTGQAGGSGRAIEAAEAAISNPLLDILSIKGAQGLLINVTGGPDMTLFEIDEAANRVRSEVGNDALVIFGSAFDPGLDGELRVSVVATGLRGPEAQADPYADEPEAEPEPTFEEKPEPEPEPVAETPPPIEPTLEAVREAVIERVVEEEPLPEPEETPEPPRTSAESRSLFDRVTGLDSSAEPTPAPEDDAHPIPAPTLPPAQASPAAGKPAETPDVPAFVRNEDKTEDPDKPRRGWASRLFRS